MKYYIPSGSWPLLEDPYVNFMRRLGHTRVNQEEADFILLPGGSDFGKQPLRDETEFLDYEIFVNTQRPVIAICRGMQLILKQSGGELIPHLPDFNNEYQHTTLTGHWRGSSSWHMTTNGLFTNTRHHQGFINSPDGWEVIDNTSDGIIEAVKRNNEFGVQWHPELPEMDGTAAQDWFIWKMEQAIK